MFCVCRRGLTPRQVLEIYSLKCTGKDRRLGASIAISYGVTPKTVRDIWNGTTWAELTSASHSTIIKSNYAPNAGYGAAEDGKILQV